METIEHNPQCRHASVCPGLCPCAACHKDFPDRNQRTFAYVLNTQLLSVYQKHGKPGKLRDMLFIIAVAAVNSLTGLARLEDPIHYCCPS